jgi:CDP-paratose 2-epimerase
MNQHPHLTLPLPARARAASPVLVTGGSGFIGSNLADSLLRDGHEVIVFDDLSRPGVVQNRDWLVERHGGQVHMVEADVSDMQALSPLVRDASAVFHLAAQTAVTTSLADPISDFAVNAAGTLNVLEAIRRAGQHIPLVFASTNKVYGALDDLAVVERMDRYDPLDDTIRSHGVGEGRPLDFCTPYGCSKGVADQYALDYATSFGIPTAVLRMSCIYGPRQFGTEDQGWVAHFLIRALKGQPITIFGNGKQVRDVLHVADAVAAYRLALEHIGHVAGRAFNLGGGPQNAVSLNQVLHEIGVVLGAPPMVERGAWRRGDQHYFVADTRGIEAALGWRRTMGWREGLRDLANWLTDRRGTDAPMHRGTMRASA